MEQFINSIADQFQKNQKYITVATVLAATAVSVIVIGSYLFQKR